MDKKRRQFTLKEKMTILEEIDSGRKKNEVAREFGIAPSTLSTILKDRKKIEDSVKERALGPQRKKIRSALHDDIDKATFTWLQNVTARNIPISGPLIRGMALEFAKVLKIESFQASVGWLNRFKERYGITSRSFCREEDGTSRERIIEWQMTNYQAYINADKNTMIVSDLENKEIVENFQSSATNVNLAQKCEDENIENTTPVSKVLFNEAMDGLQKVRDYLLTTTDVSDSILEKLYDVENFIINATKRNDDQLLITSFFKRKSK